MFQWVQELLLYCVMGDNIRHIGGIGIGGGTLNGLSRLLLNTDDIHQISDLAKKGNIGNINLQISDILRNRFLDYQ